MKKRKGFTLIELMVVILIVAILAAVAIPIMRGRIDAAKWSEGKAMMGSIATGIRAYVAEKGDDADTSPTWLELGFIVDTGDGGSGTDDLKGTYFDSADFEYEITTIDPLVFLVTATNSDLNPAGYTLDQDGAWGEPSE